MRRTLLILYVAAIIVSLPVNSWSNPSISITEKETLQIAGIVAYSFNAYMFLVSMEGADAEGVVDFSSDPFEFSVENYDLAGNLGEFALPYESINFTFIERLHQPINDL